MLMMVSSGLSRYEAQKAQQTVTPRPNTINKASLFLPLLIMTAGVSGLISVIKPLASYSCYRRVA